MIRAPGSILAVFLALAPPLRAEKVALVVSDERQATAARARAAKGVDVVAFDGVRLADPLEKGRFVAALQAAGRVVTATGGRACGWLARELEGVPIHCFMPYDGRQVLDFARAAGWRRIAAVHISGYEKVYAHLRGLAGERGIELVAVHVDRTRELTAALPKALPGVQAVWILGDPLLTRGPAFDYLVETSLSRRVPIIAPGTDLVPLGAFVGAENDEAAVLRRAVEASNAAAAGAPSVELVTEVAGGRLLVNRVLARKWGLRVPGGGK